MHKFEQASVRTTSQQKTGEAIREVAHLTTLLSAARTAQLGHDGQHPSMMEAAVLYMSQGDQELI